MRLRRTRVEFPPFSVSAIRSPDRLATPGPPPQFFTENRFEYKDDLSVTKGKHNFKTGASYSLKRDGLSFEADFNGAFAAHGVNDLLSDFNFGHDLDIQRYGYAPAYGSWFYAEATINPTVTPAVRPNYYRGFRANEYAAYLQDDWRLYPRLTLNLGVRWDYSCGFA